jgi:hypothetical protein
MRWLFALILLFGTQAASAAPSPNVETVIACHDPSPMPPDFVNGGCRRMPLRAVDPQRGQVWIRAIVTVPTNDSEQPLGVRFSAMASSELWWNGMRLASNGMPAARRVDEVSGRMDAIIALPPALIRPCRNVLVARLSAWHQPWWIARPIQQIVVERYADPTLRTLRQYWIALATAGVFALALVYFAAAWVTGRADRGSLALAILSAATLAQLGCEVSRGLVAYTYPWQAPRTAAILLCSDVVGMAMAAYAAWRYSRASLIWWLVGAGAGVSMVSLLPLSFDGRALGALAIGASVAAAATANVARTSRSARAVLAALSTFAILVFMRPDFLDRTLYLALALLAAVLFADQIVTLRRTERARASATARAAGLELALLRQSIAPHFLLNTLNSLIDWVETDPARGVQMIEVLADTFRALAHVAGLSAIPLTEEIALCRGHLAVMAFRTDARINLRVEGETQGITIPPGILLTLVENAFVHGSYADGAVFVLHIERQGAALCSLTLITPASLSRGSRAIGTGTGLAYVRARIAEAFGPGARLEAGPSGLAWTSRLIVASLP